MSDVGLSASEEAHVQHAADEAFRVLTGDKSDLLPIRAQIVDTLRKVTIEAPLHSLAVAFLLGLLIARRR